MPAPAIPARGVAYAAPPPTVCATTDAASLVRLIEDAYRQ